MGKAKRVKGLPTEGQFVAVWVANGRVWSSTFRRHRGQLQEYFSESDCFRATAEDFWDFFGAPRDSFKFFTLKESN
jgi:hypothetical protein